MSADSPSLNGELLQRSIERLNGDFLEECLSVCQKAADRQLRLLRIAEDAATEICDPFCVEAQNAVIVAGEHLLKRCARSESNARPLERKLAASLKAISESAACEWRTQVPQVFADRRQEFALRAKEVR